MPQFDEGRQINMASAAHTQVFYAHVDSNNLARGINGPLFTRQVCGGANFNGALVNPDDFHGRNPLDQPVARAPWQALVGNEHVLQAWPGNPLGLNVRIPTPVQKGDAYRSGTHYRSKHPVYPPTGSTLGLIGTQGPGIINMNGAGGTVSKKSHGFIGRSLGACQNDPQKFLKTGTFVKPLPEPKRFHYPDEDNRVPRPPKASERFAAFSQSLTPTDFVMKNQVDCIMEGSKEKAMSRRSLDVVGPKFPAGGITAPKPKKKKQVEQKSLEEIGFSRAQRADFEAILSGKAVSSPDRIKKLNNVIVQRETLTKKKKELEASRPRPHTVQDMTKQKQTAAMSRPMTMDSEYTDTSEATTEYIADNRIVKRLPMDVRHQMIRSMKRQWDEVNKEYQLLMLSLFNLDTVMKVSRKEACEAKMARLEKDIERLSKGHIYIPVDEYSHGGMGTDRTRFQNPRR